MLRDMANISPYLYSEFNKRPYPISDDMPLPDDAETLRWMSTLPTPEEWEVKEQQRIEELKKRFPERWAGRQRIDALRRKNGVLAL